MEVEEVNQTQERIRNMNKEFTETGGVPKDPAQAPAATLPSTENTPPAEPAPAPGKQPKEKQPAAAPKAAEPGDNKDNSLPLFLRNKQGEAQPAASAAEKPAAEADIPDEVFYNRLSKSTNGYIKDEKAWVAHINSHNQLVEEQQKGWEPKFPDERAKRVHQLLTQNAGNEPEAAIRLLRALSFKSEGKNEKEILFQQMLMNPKYSDMTESSAREYFEAKYDTQYELLGKPDEELTPEQKRTKIVMQRELIDSVKEARDGIKKLQDEFTAADEGPKEADKKVVDAISKAVGGFEGLKLAFSDNPAETEYLNVVPFANPEAKQELLEEILHPNDAYSMWVESFRSDDGNMDWSALAKDAFERKNHKELRKEAYDHGFKLGQLAHINKIKNSTTPKDISRNAQPAAGDKKTFQQTWREASQSK